jgi:AraC-like DNA-binding protein
MSRGTGNGWMETIGLDSGLTIGLCDYLLDHTLIGSYSGKDATLRFNILFSGSFELAVPGRKARVKSGELYLSRGPLENLQYTQPKGRAIRGMSIEMPRAMTETWMDEAADDIARKLETLILGDARHGSALPIHLEPVGCPRGDLSDILQTGARLLTIPRSTICGRLKFESMVLDMLVRMLSLHPSCCGAAKRRARKRGAVDEAVDILRAEWADPPTISALARRVGSNECYLKSDFRKRTGLSIGNFVRKLRMEKALELIESGDCNILQAAHSVGYSNPSHFSAAFKRFYGRLPSRYLARRR